MKKFFQVAGILAGIALVIYLAYLAFGRFLPDLKISQFWGGEAASEAPASGESTISSNCTITNLKAMPADATYMVFSADVSCPAGVQSVVYGYQMNGGQRVDSPPLDSAHMKDVVRVKLSQLPLGNYQMFVTVMEMGATVPVTESIDFKVEAAVTPSPTPSNTPLPTTEVPSLTPTPSFTPTATLVPYSDMLRVTADKQQIMLGEYFTLKVEFEANVTCTWSDGSAIKSGDTKMVTPTVAGENRYGFDLGTLNKCTDHNGINLYDSVSVMVLDPAVVSPTPVSAGASPAVSVANFGSPNAVITAYLADGSPVEVSVFNAPSGTVTSTYGTNGYSGTIPGGSWSVENAPKTADAWRWFTIGTWDVTQIIPGIAQNLIRNPGTYTTENCGDTNPSASCTLRDENQEVLDINQTYEFRLPESNDQGFACGFITAKYAEIRMPDGAVIKVNADEVTGWLIYVCGHLNGDGTTPNDGNQKIIMPAGTFNPAFTTWSLYNQGQGVSVDSVIQNVVANMQKNCGVDGCPQTGLLTYIEQDQSVSVAVFQGTPEEVLTYLAFTNLK